MDSDAARLAETLSLGSGRPPANSEIGFMTLAFGSPDYAEMAVDMALSLREWHSEPLAIAVDDPTAAYIADRHPTVFDMVLRLPKDVPPGWASKLAIAEVSPFARTVFIDADIIVVGALHSLLADAERVDFAMIGGHLKSPTAELHAGVPIQDLIRQFGLARYFGNHSGTFVFERDYGRRFLAECSEVWSKELSLRPRRPSEFLSDELAFGVVAARRGMVTIRNTPVYWWWDFQEPRPFTWKPLCHLNQPPPHRTMKWLMAGAAERRRRAGLSASIAHWLRKTNRTDRSAGWLAALRNCDVRLHAAWRSYQYSGRHLEPAAALRGGTAVAEYAHPLPHRAGTESRGLSWEWAGAAMIERTRQASNLLLHGTRHRQIIGTPHNELAIVERWTPDSEMPVALAIHCWPGAPQGLCVSARWLQREQKMILAINLRGPLPEHPDAVVCVRFRGREAKELDPTVSLLANLRSSLVSNGVLQNSVTAVGVGDDYLASVAVEEAGSTCDHEFFLQARQWPADHDELFLEFRLAVAGLERSDAGVEIELSCFYLGQKPEESAFGGRSGAPVLAAPDGG